MQYSNQGDQGTGWYLIPRLGCVGAYILEEVRGGVDVAGGIVLRRRTNVSATLSPLPPSLPFQETQDLLTSQTRKLPPYDKPWMELHCFIAQPTLVVAFQTCGEEIRGGRGSHDCKGQPTDVRGRGAVRPL